MSVITLRKPKAPTGPSDDFPLMTAAEAAEKLGISVKSVMSHVHAGRLRFINIGTAKRKSYRFTPKNLSTFIANQKVRETPKCLSLQIKKASIKLTSSLKDTGFSAMPKPGTGAKPKP
ncbi:helix-turn-helix domain-containing protein [Frigidibacter oleivorans]|uniref:helix-turn-helix domain-containing protein n=1 Tax=Frigidibacter oleivorans TaxID=2487129 RepID=UPI000F8EF29C|nr:helix-turn-helix domain-containing protein [Frigidibacter oleivorans]